MMVHAIDRYYEVEVLANPRSKVWVEHREADWFQGRHIPMRMRGCNGQITSRYFIKGLSYRFLCSRSFHSSHGFLPPVTCSW